MKKFVVLLLLAIGVVSCEDPNIGSEFKAADLDPIALGLSKYPEYSTFVEMLEMVDLYNALNLSNYDFTVFVASNEVVDKYVWYYNDDYGITEEAADSLGVDPVQYTSIYDLPLTAIEILMKYHVVVGYSYQAADLYLKLAYPTATGDYLTAGLNIDTGDRYIDNGDDKNASSIIVRDMEFINGYAHEVDNMLQPVTSTLWDLIQANTDYTIFAEAVVLCGLEDFYTRNQTEVNGVTVDEDKTVFVVPNYVFNDQDIYTIDDLVELFPSDDHTLSTAPLHHWLLYHTMLDAIGYAELTAFPYHTISSTYFPNKYHNLETMASMTMLSVLDSANTIWLNPHAGSQYGVAQIDEYNMDIPAYNGYLHEIDKMLNVPSYISRYYFIWDPFKSLEARSIEGFRTVLASNSSSVQTELELEQIPSFTWSSVPVSAAKVTYYNSGFEKGLTDFDGYFNGDGVIFDVGTNGYIIFETPIQPIGTFYMYCVRLSDGTGGKFNLYWDDYKFKSDFNFNIDEYALNVQGPMGSGTTNGTTQVTHKLKMEPSSSDFGTGGFDVFIFCPY